VSAALDIFALYEELHDPKRFTEAAKKPRGKGLFLEPLTSKIKVRDFLTFDIESKDGDDQRAGFTRPFLVGAFDGVKKKAWRNARGVDKRLPWNERACARGGCIDRFLRWVLRPQLAGRAIYSHAGGTFDELHLLPWLRAHHDEFDFEIIPVQSAIQMIRVWRRATMAKAERQKKDKSKLVWLFLDSFRLLPMSLERACQSFGLPGKEEMDLHAPEDDPRWEPYLGVDCVRLYQVLGKVHELMKELGGEVGITAPSSSMKLFRRKYLAASEVKRIPIHREWEERETASRQPPAARELDVFKIAESSVSGRERELDVFKIAEGARGQVSSLAGDLGPETGDRKSEKPKAFFAYGVLPPTFHDWVRLAYYGGRTEIFEMFGEGLKYFDFNASYMASMLEGMPAGDRIVVEPDENGDARLDWRLAETHVGFAECTVHIPSSCYLPPLPYRHPESNKLIFPAGDFRGVWDVDELALLKEPSVKGEIRHVRRVVWIGRKKVFDTMMREIWRMRDKSLPGYDKGRDAFGKLMGLSLYGKFGMKEERKTIVLEQAGGPGTCMLCGERIAMGLAVCKGCEGATPASPNGEGGVWYKKATIDAPYVIPQISAHVTSLARIRLWKALQGALDLGGRVYCSDTDSVMTDVDMPSSKALGALKDEYPGIPLRGRFVQPKVYMLERMDGLPFDDEHGAECPMEEAARRGVAREDRPVCAGCSTAKVTMKGFPKAVRTKENLEKLIAGDAVSFSRLEKIGSMARKGFKTPPEMVEIAKRFRSRYDKRVVMPDGTTKPVVLRLALP
jgi:hypothetical protein